MLQNTVLAVLFAVGVAIGWGASSIRETDAPPGATSKRSQQTSSETRTEVDAIAVASAELDQTAARLSSYESYEDETDEFDGTITGRVFDASGAGLQGVEVIAGVAGHRRGRKSAIDLSLEDYVRQALDDHHFRQAHERRARSDTDGNFTLEGVGPDEYWVHAELEGFLFTVAEGSKVRRIEAGGNVELVGSVAGTIDIEVVLPAGVWSDSLWVSVKQEDASRSTRRWASEVITIPALVGEATIAATSLELVAEPISVSVVAGEVAQAQLRMEPKLGVRGQIFYESGQPLDQGIVRFMRSSATLTPEGLAKSNEAETDWYSLGDEYRFSVDEPGTYVVGVGFDQRRVDHMETIEVTDGVVRLDIYLPDPSPSEVIVVSVVGPKGEPLDDLGFMLRWKSDRGSSSWGLRGRPGPDGTHWVLPDPETLEKCDAEGGTLTLTVRSAEYGSQSVEIAPSNMKANVQFSEPARLEATVVGIVGHELQGLISVVLVSTEEGRNSSPTSKPDAEGIARFEAITPGEYALQLQVKDTGDRWSSSIVQKETIHIEPGENAGTISVPPLYRVAVTFDEVGTQRRVGFKSVDEQQNWRQGEIDPNTREVIFDHVSPGRYRLQRFGSMVDQMTIDVQSDINVVFTSDTINAFVVQIRDTSGKLARAGFRHGDLVVALNGKEFANRIELSIAMTMVMTRPEVTVTVQRGGSTLELKIKPQEMMEGNVGGSLEPASK